jgi:Tfp pilus assembly protein PilF
MNANSAYSHRRVKRRSSRLGPVWVSEFLWILAALALSFAQRERGSGFALGLALLGLAFVQRWFTAGRLSRPTPFDPAMGLLTAGALVGLWAAYDVRLSRSALLAVLGCVALYYAVANMPRPVLAAQVVVWIGLGVATYFLIQYRYIPHEDKVGLASAIGMFTSSLFPRLGSWDPFSNSVATLLEGLIPLSLALTIAGQGRPDSGPERVIGRVVNGMSTGLMALAVLVTASRGAWVALVVAGVVWMAVRWLGGPRGERSPRRRGVLVLIGVGCTAALALGGYLWLARGSTVAKLPLVGSVLYALFARPDRLEVYRGSWDLITSFAFTGIGPGRVYTMVYSRYVLLIPHVLRTYSHNLYLTIWLGHGLLGVIGMGWLLIALGDYVIGERREGHTSLLFQASWVGLIVVLVHGLFDSLQYEHLWTMWPPYVLLGLVVALGSQALGASKPRVISACRMRWIHRSRIGGLVLSVVALVVFWRPLAALAWTNAGMIRQARAELNEELSRETKRAYLGDAVVCYERTLRLDPDNRIAHLRLGTLAMDAGHYEDAVFHLESALAAGPHNPTARKALGLAYVWDGRLDEAEPLLLGVPDIAKELNAWGWWREQQGEQALSQYAYQMSQRLDSR